MAAAAAAATTPTSVVLSAKQFLEHCNAIGKRTCSDYIRGCREELDVAYPRKKCAVCLKVAREKDQAKAAAAMKVARMQVEAAEMARLNGTIDEAPAERTCTGMCKKTQPLDQFRGGEKGGAAILKTCRTCRAKCKKADTNRDRQHRNALARVAEAKPERKEVKREWVENNPEKVVLKSVKFRLGKIQNNVEEYLGHNAAVAKNWRVNNPDKVSEINTKKKKSIHASFGIYGRTAHDKNVPFELSFEEFDVIVRQPCHYCNATNEEKGFIGIDRKIPELGYVLANCAPCCTMCNFMKLSASYEIFLLRVEHIVVHNAMVVEEVEESVGAPTLHPDAFMDHAYGGCGYPVVFNELISQPCYICGKCNSDKHQNGVDRFDSKLGYEVVSNCRSCCSDCNYMKNKFDYDDVMMKLRMIYETRIRPFLANRHVVLNSCPERAPLQSTRNLSAVVAKKSKQERQEITASKKILKQQALEKNYVERVRQAKEAVEAAEMVKKVDR